MNSIVQEDYDEFFKKYQPITVPLGYRDSSLNDEYGNDISWCCFRTPPERLEDPNYIWTAVNVDGSLYFIQGIHYVNREYYLIASVPFKEGDKEEYCYHYEIEETDDENDKPVTVEQVKNWVGDESKEWIYLVLSELANGEYEGEQLKHDIHETWNLTQ